MDEILASEHEEQCALVRWWELAFPRYSELLFAIPNGGLRNLKVAKKLKAEGVRAGVADLFLAIPSHGWHGLFIEMKRKKGGRQSEAQKCFQAAVKGQSYAYVLTHGWDEASNAIRRYLKGKDIDYLPPMAEAIDVKEDWLTVSEVQRILNVSRSTVYTLLESGKLEGLRVGYGWRISRRSFENFAVRVSPMGRRNGL